MCLLFVERFQVRTNLTLYFTKWYTETHRNHNTICWYYRDKKNAQISNTALYIDVVIQGLTYINSQQQTWKGVDLQYFHDSCAQLFAMMNSRYVKITIILSQVARWLGSLLFWGNIPHNVLLMSVLNSNRTEKKRNGFWLSWIYGKPNVTKPCWCDHL